MPAAEIICLPELGKTLGVNEQPQTVEFVIQQDTTVKMLREKLKEYGLQTTGKKADLIERLHKYAADDTSWRLLFQPARKGTRGSYTGRRTAKQSAQRITSQFWEHELTLVQHKSKLGVGCVVQSLTPADIDNNNAWPENTLTIDGPTHKAADALQVVGTQRPAAQSANMLLSATEQPTSFTPQFSTHTNLPPAGTMYPAHELTTEDRQSLSLRFRCLERTIAGLEDTLIEQTAIPTQSIPPSNLAILQLEGRELAFDKTMVMPPLAVWFSTDISALFRERHQSTYLVVNGHGIPIKFWGDVYKKCTGQNSKAWALQKVQWGQWKFIMEEHLRFASDDAFWMAWTDANGQRVGYTKLCDTLQHQQMARDTRDAATARSFFGGNLDHLDAQGMFRYAKSGVSKLMSKDVDIARKWRELLTINGALAQRWKGSPLADTLMPGLVLLHTVATFELNPPHSSAAAFASSLHPLPLSFIPPPFVTLAPWVLVPGVQHCHRLIGKLGPQTKPQISHERP
ncbi:uncharacterized protein HD556DRAFT_1312722 [Suillus plorans]|uniref:SAP domain-containing protein n=1 Tax=Suillus plorans TaxID=116603 RepID=A0A9P7AE33_9AGAM|nr:uncharacterized protein HD556DRAFT_1312722 [Suillus plorans]KAG1787536.1 hypothetical protein HD556DRAFT_1312722 [Suillus plorans]